MKPSHKLSEEIASDIRARIKAFDFGTGKKLEKAKEQNGTFDVIISTEVKDRAGEIVRQDGWDLANYKNNPIVLWGHDYYGLPIGVCTETYKTEYRGVPALAAKGVFYPESVNPLAQQVRKAYDFGVAHGVHAGCTTSVGFIPKEYDPEDRSIITNAELLEFSFVPVPANQGVGAAGRALTSAEAKELGLDVAGLVLKGFDFVETKDVEHADDDTTEDTTEVDSEPTAAKSEELKDPREPQKKLVKSLNAESDRHMGEVDKALDEFRTKAVVEDQPDQNDGDEDSDDQEPIGANGSASETVRESIKDLRSSIADEHTNHKAEVIKCFKSFEPTDETKALDINKHLKAARVENGEYEARTNKSIDEFEEKCLKSVKTVQGQPGEIDEHTDWITGILDAHGRAHKKAIVNIAKNMCKEALGDKEITDDKTLEIVKETIAPFIGSKNLIPVAIRIAAELTTERRKMLGEAYSNLKAAVAIVEGLHGALGNDDGDESRSVEDDTSSKPAPKKQRSRPSEDVREDELDAHLLAKDILRRMTTLTQEGLKTLKERSVH